MRWKDAINDIGKISVRFIAYKDHDQDRADRNQGFEDFAREIAVDNHEKFYAKSGRL